MAIVPQVSGLAPRLLVLCFGGWVREGGWSVASAYSISLQTQNFESRPNGACMQAIMQAISLAFHLCYQDGVATFKTAVFFKLGFSLMVVLPM